METTLTMVLLNATENEMMLANEAAMQEYRNHCLYDGLPTARTLVSNMNVFDMAFHVLLLALATATVAVFVELVFFLKENVKQSARRRLSIIQASIPSVFAVSSVVGIFSPGGYIMIDFVSSVYFGFAIHSFLVLIINYYGGLRQLLLRFKKRDKKFQIHTGPLCCFFFCLPKFEMTKKNFTVLWYATFQAALFRPIILFFEAVFNFDASITVSPLVYGGFMVFSMLSGVWALVILRKASGSFLNRYRITGKYFTFQLILLISNLQPFLIKAFYNACDLPQTVLAKKIILGYQIMVFEFCVLGLLTRFLYRRSSDDENLERIEEKIDLSDDLNHMNGICLAEKKPLAEDEVANGNHMIMCIEENNRTDQDHSLV